MAVATLTTKARDRVGGAGPYRLHGEGPELLLGGRCGVHVHLRTFPVFFVACGPRKGMNIKHTCVHSAKQEREPKKKRHTNLLPFYVLLVVDKRAGNVFDFPVFSFSFGLVWFLGCFKVQRPLDGSADAYMQSTICVRR